MSGPLVQAIGWALLHLLWQGTIVAAILAAALALLRKQSANVRYLASCGALLLVVALGVATAYRLYVPPVASDSLFSAPSVGAAAVVRAAADEAPASTPVPFSLLALLGAHIAEIVMVWLAGVLVLSARLFAGWVGARRLARRNARTASEQWQRSLWRIASALRLWKPVDLLESAAVEVPTVVGWLRPVVLLPIASLSGLSTQQVEMVLAHELAHIRRHDFIVNLLQSVVETLLFYHPAVWWISQRIRVEREHCCDDLAVAVFGDPLQYARALTRFEELRLRATQTALAANGGSLLGRIRRLVAARAESASWSSRWAAGAALLTVLAMIFAAPALPAFANHDDSKPPAKAKKAETAAKEKCKTDDEDCAAKKSETSVNVKADTAVDETDSSDEDAAPEAPQVEVTPPPAIAPRAAVSATPAIAPMVAVSVSPALPQAAPAPMVTPAPDIVGGVVGGILDGVVGGIAAPRAHIGNIRRHHIGENGKLTVDDLIELRTAGVTPKYIDEMRGAGIGKLSLDDIVQLRTMNVTPAYLKEMADAGYSNLNTEQLITLRAMNVTPQFVKSLADAGYTNLSVKDLINLKASGVDADFIRDLAKYRSK
ncbi:MAG TPA: M56 family metallopeptidase [Thermoanaerobaculia bacterium]|nr:M56 family metallopeptidase [Thermoanaerobaculia bacterium]